MKQILFIVTIFMFVLTSCSQVGKEVGSQIAKQVAKEAVENEVEQGAKVVAKDAVKNGEKEAVEQVAKQSVEASTKQELKNAILGRAKETGRYVSRTASRLMIRSKNQYITADKYLKWLSNPNNQIIKGAEKDASILRQNMYKVMSDKESKFAANSLKNGNAAHHIVGNSTSIAASKLKKFGIDINDPMNGIFLPTSNNSGLKGVVHVGGHNQRYYDYINNRFRSCHNKKQCYEVLDDIKSKLFNGDIKLYNETKNNINHTFTSKTAA